MIMGTAVDYYEVIPYDKFQNEIFPLERAVKAAIMTNWKIVSREKMFKRYYIIRYLVKSVS